MNVAELTEYETVILKPDPGDDPEDLEDQIHDALTATEAKLVVLDVGDVPQDEFATWLKAAGPEIPDARLRLVVNPARFKVAQVLGLTAFHEFYGTVADALTGGA